MWKFVAVFFAAALSDWIWAAYIMYTADKKAVRSSLLSGLIILIGAFVTMSYLQDTRTLVTAIAGGMLGTYLCVKYWKH